MFAADFILGHFILFLVLPVLLVPYVDKFHSVMLFWLRPSRQIRPPIYSLKQTKLRKRRVIRYAILYFIIFVVFVALIAGPVVAGKFMKINFTIPMDLLQPTGLNNNDTTTEVTGTCLQGACPGPGGGDAASTGTIERFARIMAF